MSSDSGALNRLIAIEQDISISGPKNAHDQLNRFLERYDSLDETCKEKAQNIRLQILIGIGDFDELARVIDNNQPVSKESEIRFLISKGILANRDQNYQQSLIHFLEAESKASLNGDELLMAQVQINIGTVYAGLHHYHEGMSRYAGAMRSHRKLLSKPTQAALLHNLGNLNYSLGDIDESIRCLEESIAIQNDSTIHRSQLLLKRSYLSKGVHSDQKIPEIEEPSDLYPIYAYCLSFEMEPTQRLEMLEKVVRMAQDRIDFKTALDALEQIISHDKAEGNFELALRAFETYRSIEQSLLATQQKAQLAEQAARYEIAEKEQSIKMLQKEKALQDEIVKRNDMLEAVNEELRQFAYVVSHDLKEPLRMIGSYTQLIEMGLQDKVDPDNREYFDFVSGGVSRLNVLLDGLSSYSTLKTLQEDHETVNLAKIINIAIENLDVLIKETKTELSIDADIELKGSGALLVLLFQNLIQNGIKFRKVDTIARIEIKASRINEKLVIDISDNGVGIAENQRERVFVIFQRLSKAGAVGSGMGLAICKKIVQLHDGIIVIKDNRISKGTTFRIELPNKIHSSTID